MLAILRRVHVELDGARVVSGGLALATDQARVVFIVNGGQGRKDDHHSGTGGRCRGLAAEVKIFLASLVLEPGVER